MLSAVLALALAASGAAPEPPPHAEPPNQTVVFYNARIALREDRPADVLRLWLLRNALHNRGERATHDGEFRSVLWAALGKLGYCQDAIPTDVDGAGLWPLALHNWVLHAMSKGPPPPTSAPWDAYTVALQQRFVSLHDVLSAEELRSVSFFRTDCLRAYTALAELGHAPWVDLGDRLAAGLLLQQLLERSRATLVREKVESLAVIDTRLFDLDLALSDLRARRARSLARSEAQQARSVGVSKEAAGELREKLRKFPEGSPQAEFLRRSLTWRPEEWLQLSKPRRLFLFKQARPLAQDEGALQRLVLGIADLLIAQRRGDELESWIGYLEAEGAAALREAVVSGDRGARLLELEPSTGFRERAPIALHRGVAFLAAGAEQDALRSFAFALRHAEESREAATTVALARRWLSYVLSRYQTTDEVIATLKVLVPKQEYNAVVEDLAWRAALRADPQSFQRVAQSIQRGTALDARLERLRRLAHGDPGQLASALRAEVGEEPYAVLRFVRQLVERIESEDPDVRGANVPTLKLLLAVLDPVAANPGGRSSAHARTAGELIGRIQAVLDGLRLLDDSGPGKARALSPQSETFAGSIRLAPADALPWPFRAPNPEPPSAFTQLLLIPIEWHDARGERVFGWRLTE